jgi:hypothetical protein
MATASNISLLRCLTKQLLWLVIGGIVGACAATVPVRVLPQGETHLVASLGGPIVPDKTPTVVVPYLTAGMAYGVTNEVTLHGMAHITMAMFGVAGVDVGASTRLMKHNAWQPEATIALRAMMMTDGGGWATTRLWPTVSTTFSWLDGSVVPFVGGHLTFELTNGKPLVSPNLGMQIELSDYWWLHVEGIWQAANANTRSGVLEGQSSIGGNGSAGLFIAARMRL